MRYMTAGESHGRGIMVILDGMPAGLAIDQKFVASELKRRMHGYGRGGRMAIEPEKPEFVSGCRKGVTIGSPIGIMIHNADHKIDELEELKKPRPGHADLAGIHKYGFDNARDVLERASARETAMRVAAGSCAKLLLKEFGMRITSHVTMIGGIEADTEGLSFDQIEKAADISASKVRCADAKAEKLMCEAIDRAREEKDTLGGSFEVLAVGVPPGLGSYVQWDRKLDGTLARAVVSIPAVKAVSIGKGLECASRKGSLSHDAIGYDASGKVFTRSSNNAGGLEGGVTNGQAVVVKGFMKPIATLGEPLSSVDIDTKKTAGAATERSDVSAVAACGVVAESTVAIELASAFLEKFGGDSVGEIKRNYNGYMSTVKEI
ncbi:MAG: chorismate synthase [Candidatus Omnitrophica bacterium]|nr:chorismate synthase [Candidatus Omnitrophota bacterium]